VYNNVNGVAFKGEALEEDYRSSDLEPQSFRAKHKHNFIFVPSEVSQITIDYTKNSHFRPNRRAMLTIQGSGKPKTFAIVGRVNMAEATDWLRQMGPVAVRGDQPAEANR
jgi:hypothetical protein